MANLYVYGFALVAVVCYASLTPIAKKVGLDIPPFSFIALTMPILSLYAIIAAWLFEKDFTLNSLGSSDYAGLVLFSLINFIGFALYIYVIKQIPATQYQLIAVITPVVTGIIAYFLIGETFHWRYIAGLAFMFVGLAVALYQPGRTATNL